MHEFSWIVLAVFAAALCVSFLLRRLRKGRAADVTTLGSQVFLRLAVAVVLSYGVWRLAHHGDVLHLGLAALLAVMAVWGVVWSVLVVWVLIRHADEVLDA